MYYILNNVPEKFDKNIIENAIDFCCNKLNLDNVKEIIFSWDLDEYYGECVNMGDGIFDIFLNKKLTLLETLRTIFHELIHVKQFSVNDHQSMCMQRLREKHAYHTENILLDFWFTFNSI